ncbi:MAG: exodeoxyribonuclease VII large subunit [Myxococcota bacterium]|jgi:exodeoxyribonuclease VII large subunit|nr:exodeoxyribonuclease VII large subunit [Myxococcota bacterium]
MPEAASEQQKTLSVSEVNVQAKHLLEKQFSTVRVSGEISNLKNVSGHYYLTLKDSASQLSAVLFRRQATALKFRLENGLELIATGKLTVYPPYGRYQLMVEHVEPKGVGNLQLAFEQLKKKLEQEGLFAQERKRLLPMVPRRVAVISSATGAVIRDIIHVASRRFKGAQILLFPSRVQGEAAVEHLIAALAKANGHAREHDLDVIILARGGGSLEDLWCFNDEKLARAIHASELPVVSAVGHETDYTIADFVADCRAPTPSAAAEIVFPKSQDLLNTLLDCQRRVELALKRRIKDQQTRIVHARLKLFKQASRISEEHQRLAYALLRLEQQIQTFVHRKQRHLEFLNQRLIKLHPALTIREYLLKVQHYAQRQEQAMLNKTTEARHVLANSSQNIHALSPLNILGRGYSIVQNISGDVIRSSNDVAQGDDLDIRLRHGSLKTQVLQIIDK